MQITGKLYQIDDVVQVSPTFRKREFVLEHSDNPMYPQHNLFQVTQDNCALLDGYNVGDEVNVTFNLRGRKWTSPSGDVKFFNSLEMWRIARVGNGTPVTTAVSSEPDDDDVPF